MLGRDHQITSACIATSTVTWIPYPTTALIPSVIFIGATTFGALLPDIDSRNSIISKTIKIPFYKGIKHRGMSHSLIGWILFSLILYMILHTFLGMPSVNLLSSQSNFLILIWLGLTCGYFLHLLEDSWSQAGVIWGLPFSSIDKKTYKKKGWILRPVNHWGKNHGHYIPIRHFWGRGYQVGSGEENAIVGLFIIIMLISLIHLIM